MARQNIDEEWKSDPRRKLLVKRLGNERLADGMRVEINWLILDHKGRPIPLKKFKFVEDYEVWIDCGLAEIKDDFVEIAGSNRYSEWFEKQKENGSKGGRPKKNPEEPNETQNNPNEPNEEKDNPKNPSYSFSSSFKNLNTYTDFQESDPEPPPEPEPDDPLPTRSDFEALYKRLYPRKEGKKRGIDICMAKYRTWEHLANLETAIAKYVAHCKKKNQFLKHFDSFMGEWTDCLDEDFGTESLKVVKVTNAAPDPFDHEINLIYQARRQFNSWQETEARVWLGVSAELVDRLGGWTEVQMLSDDTASRNKIIKAIKATQEVPRSVDKPH